MVCRDTDPNNWFALLGDHDRQRVESAQLTMRVLSTIVHGSYDPNTNANDIALLKLAEPIAYTSEISPICLPEVDTVFRDGMECVVTGWGVTSTGVCL